MPGPYTAPQLRVAMFVSAGASGRQDDCLLVRHLSTRVQRIGRLLQPTTRAEARALGQDLGVRRGVRSPMCDAMAE